MILCHSDAPRPAVLTRAASRWHTFYCKFHHCIVQRAHQMLMPLGNCYEIDGDYFCFTFFMSPVLFSLFPPFCLRGSWWRNCKCVMNRSAGCDSSIKLSIHQVCSVFVQEGTGWLVSQDCSQVMERLSLLNSRLCCVRNLSNLKLFQCI